VPEVPVVVGLAAPFSVGRVIPEIVLRPTPAVASGFTYTVGGKYWERIVSVDFKLVTDGNAANRIVTLAYQDQDAREFARTASPFAQAAGITTQYGFGIGMMQFGAASAASIGGPLPSLFLRPGHKLVVSIAAVQAGDQVSLVTLYIERFPTGPEGYRQGAYVVDEAPDVIAESV
jgi:hypothetical protein